MSKGLQIAVATLSVFVAVGWLVASNEGAFEFFEQVSELSAEDMTRSEGLRIRGFVMDGSIHREMREGYVDFEIREGEPVSAPAGAATEREAYRPVRSGGPTTLKVRYAGIDVPDLFRDGAEVVVEGGFVNGQFVATRLLAKCPSKYEVAPGLPEQKA